MHFGQSAIKTDEISDNFPRSSSLNSFTDVSSEPGSPKSFRTVQKEPNEPPPDYTNNVEDKTPPSDGFTGQNLKTRGGYTCCVPGCYNNNKKNKDLHFYRFPQGQSKEKQQLRKKQILLVSRKNFKPSPHHRVCSAHLPGGAKTYDNNIPNIVPKTPSDSKCKESCNFSPKYGFVSSWL